MNINTTLPLPALIIFGVDFTIWPFEVGYKSRIYAPFTETSDGIVDRNGNSVKCYPDVSKIFKELQELHIKIALTSINTENSGIQQLIFLFGLEQYISYKEMGPDSKMNQVQRIHEASGIKYSDMLFFDDEFRNVHHVDQLRVMGILVNYGMHCEVVENGIRDFQKRKAEGNFDY